MNELNEHSRNCFPDLSALSPLFSRPSAREAFGLARPEIKQSYRFVGLITVLEGEAATLKLTEQAPAA
ncbi:MAG TPA: hypothetical protein VGM44_16965 [Polyangiaceae bacterium]